MCKKIYLGETGRTLADRFREHLRDLEKTTQMRPYQLRAILIFLITPATIWLLAGYPYTGNTESGKNLKQKFIFQLGLLFPRGTNKRLQESMKR